jgi:hypothetical protein
MVQDWLNNRAIRSNIIYALMSLCVGIIGLLKQPTLSDMKQYEGDVEYLKLKNDYYFKSAKVFLDGYVIKLKNDSQVFEIWSERKRELVKKVAQSANHAIIWVDINNVEQLSINRNLIFEYRFWDQFGGFIIWTSSTIILFVICMIFTVKHIKSKSNN